MQSQANQKGGVDESIPLKAKAVPPYTPIREKELDTPAVYENQ